MIHANKKKNCELVPECVALSDNGLEYLGTHHWHTSLCTGASLHGFKQMKLQPACFPVSAHSCSLHGFLSFLPTASESLASVVLLPVQLLTSTQVSERPG